MEQLDADLAGLIYGSSGSSAEINAEGCLWAGLSFSGWSEAGLPPKNTLLTSTYSRENRHRISRTPIPGEAQPHGFGSLSTSSPTTKTFTRDRTPHALPLSISKIYNRSNSLPHVGSPELPNAIENTIVPDTQDDPEALSRFGLRPK